MASAEPQVRELVARHLQRLHADGVTQLPRVAVTAAAGSAPPEADRGEPTVQLPSASADPTADAATGLATLAAEVAACTLCQELATTRTQTVFGAGHPRAKLCFLGEAPGADEDRQGEPFVGRAGQLLNRILAACRLRRDDVYILNILKCRPPGNRNPQPAEAAHCRPFLDRQLALIRPEFICCLGTIAAQNLLDTTESIGRLRGRFHPYQEMQVLCTYHPAYLLRNPAAKRHVWDDMKMLMRAMGVDLDSN
jgi:uracil-DNA glycosylase family 4